MQCKNWKMLLPGNEFWYNFPSVMADKIKFVLEDAPYHAKISEINIHKEGREEFRQIIKLMTIYSAPKHLRENAVSLYSSSGSFQDNNPASRVLFYSRNDDDYTSWIADYTADDWWFVLDLSTKMSFDAVKIANSVCKPYNDGYTKGFRQD